MHEVLSKALVLRFPWATYKKGGKVIGMDGIECENGWFNLIWDMFTELETVYSVAKLKEDMDITTIKEKYGVLTMYYTSSLVGINEVVKKYVLLSEGVCEKCGSEGGLKHVLEGSDWVFVLCDTCMNARDEVTPEVELLIDTEGALKVRFKGRSTILSPINSQVGVLGLVTKDILTMEVSELKKKVAEVLNILK